MKNNTFNDGKIKVKNIFTVFLLLFVVIFIMHSCNNYLTSHLKIITTDNGIEVQTVYLGEYHARIKKLDFIQDGKIKYYFRQNSDDPVFHSFKIDKSNKFHGDIYYKKNFITNLNENIILDSGKYKIEVYFIDGRIESGNIELQ